MTEGDENMGVGGSTPPPRTKFPDETPFEVAIGMIAHLEIEPHNIILEPGAGLGSIADAVRQAYPENRVVCLELNEKRYRILKDKGHYAYHQDFFLFKAFHPDRIIMNPPRDALPHLIHAYRLLPKGGIMVALVHAHQGMNVDFAPNVEVTALKERTILHEGKDVPSLIFKVRK